MSLIPTPPEHSSAVDLSMLEQLTNNNAVKYRKFALLFLSTMEDVLQQIDAACAQSDVRTLAEMGHRAKSTSLSVGAASLSRQFSLLEQAARAGDAATAASIAQSLRPMFHLVRIAIECRLAA